jgi:hypothetical protein
MFKARLSCNVVARESTSPGIDDLSIYRTFRHDVLAKRRRYAAEKHEQKQKTEFIQIVSSFRCRKHPKGLRAGKCHPAKFHHWFGHREMK